MGVARQATLEEVVEADLLLHVMDGSSDQMLQQREAVLAVLRRLGISEMRLQSGLIEVINKADLLESDARADSDGENFEDDPQEAEIEPEAAAVTASDSGDASAEPAELAAAGSSAAAEGVPSASAAAEQRSAGVGSISVGVGQDAEGTSQETGEEAGSPALEWARSRAGRQPSMVVTSAVTGRGLEDLLLEIDKKVRSLAHAV